MPGNSLIRPKNRYSWDEEIVGRLVCCATSVCAARGADLSGQHAAHDRLTKPEKTWARHVTTAQSASSNGTLNRVARTQKNSSTLRPPYEDTHCTGVCAPPPPPPQHTHGESCCSFWRIFRSNFRTFSTVAWLLGLVRGGGGVRAKPYIRTWHDSTTQTRANIRSSSRTGTYDPSVRTARIDADESADTVIGANEQAVCCSPTVGPFFSMLRRQNKTNLPEIRRERFLLLGTKMKPSVCCSKMKKQCTWYNAEKKIISELLIGNAMEQSPANLI
jgi:hypothetical protein